MLRKITSLLFYFVLLRIAVQLKANIKLYLLHKNYSITSTKGYIGSAVAEIL